MSAIVCCAVVHGLPADAAAKVEATARAMFGGARHFVAKGTRRRMTPEQRVAAYEAGLTNASNEELTAKYKISRSSLYRLMKRGP